MKKMFAIIIFFAFTVLTQAHIPQKCFEIENILVDACVSDEAFNKVSFPACNCEGKNEILLFRTGPNPILVRNINIVWPNNVFQEIDTTDV